MSTILPENLLRCMNGETRKSLGKPGRTIAEVGAAEEAKAEREIHAQIMQTLRRHDIDFIHSPMNKRSFLPEGWEDFTIFLPMILSPALPEYRSIVWFVEVKTSTGKLRPKQEEITERHRAQGFRVSVVRSYQEFADELRALLVPFPSSKET